MKRVSPVAYHFSADSLQCFADIPNLFCWERSTADSCGIRFANSDDVLDIKGVESWTGGTSTKECQSLRCIFVESAVNHPMEQLLDVQKE